MKFLFLIFMVLFSATLFADTNQDFNGAEFSFNHGQGWQKYQLGTKVQRDSPHELKVQYTFSATNSAIGTYNLLYPPSPGGPGGAAAGGNGFDFVPKNAIVIGCFIDVITAVTSGGAATIAISSGKSAADLLAATAKTSFTAGAILACIPTGSAATSFKMTADVVPTVTIAAAALTAGKFNVHIQYLMSDP